MKRRVLSMILVLSMLISLGITGVSAADPRAITFDVQADKTTIQPGDTVKLTISVTDAQDSGLGSMQFDLLLPEQLEYQSHQLLCDDKQFVMKNYNEKAGNFAAFGAPGINDASWDVMELTCKVKEDAMPGTLNVAFSGPVAGTSEDVELTVNTKSLDLTIPTPPIEKVAVEGLQAPAKGAAPDPDVTVTPAGLTPTVEWYVGNTKFDGAVFAANTVYTAKITLTAAEPDHFAETVTAEGFEVDRQSDQKIVLSKTFEKTADRVVTALEITKQPTKTEYVEGETFDRAGMAVKVSYDVGEADTDFEGYTVEPEIMTAGTTFVTISYGGQSATVNVDVLKQPTASDFTITLPQNAVYDGNEKAAAITANAGVGEVVNVRYNGSETAPTDAGTYEVTFDVEKGTDYVAAVGLKAGSFDIGKAPTDIKVTSSEIQIVKDNPTSLGAATVPEGLQLTYQSADTKAVRVDEAGMVTGLKVTQSPVVVTVSYAGDNNHEKSSATVNVTVIEKQPVEVTFEDAKTATYTGSAFKLGEQFKDATVAGDNKTITGYRYGDQEYATREALNAVEVTDAGTYEVTAYYESATEYGAATAEFVIEKADQTALAVNASAVQFGQDLSLTTSGGNGTGDVSYAVTDGTGKATITGNTLTPVKAGTVTVVATKAADKNYNEIKSAETTITISKAAAVTLSELNKSHTIGTTGEQTVSLAGLMPADAGALTYVKVETPDAEGIVADGWTVSEDGTVAYTLTGVGDAGKTAALQVTIQSDNYEDSAVKVVIELTDKKLPVVTAEDLEVTYTGNAVADAAIKGTSDVEGTWSFKAGQALTNVADSGAKTVVFTPAAELVDYAPVEINIQLTIQKAKATGTPEYTKITQSGKTLADANLTAGTITPAGGVIVWNDALDTKVEKGQAYGWTYTPADAENYEVLTGSITLWRAGGSGGGSGTADSNSVAVDGNVEHGSVSFSPKNASKGETVTITVKPDEGYLLDTLTVKDKNGNIVELKEKGNNQYSFVMPGTKVAVEVKFKEGSKLTQFTDVKDGAWYSEAVEYVVNEGIMQGTNATTFSPDSTLTRGMIVTILHRLEGTPESKQSAAFLDVSAEQYYADAVAWAAENGIVTGYGDGNFGPEDYVTREQMAQILYNYAKLKGYDMPQHDIAIEEFADFESISSWAVEAMTWAVNVQLMEGQSANVLNPTGTATRAEAAKLLMEFDENLTK